MSKSTTENFDYKDECIEDTKETVMSTQALITQKNWLIDLKQNLRRYVITLPVFEFNCGRFNLNLIKLARVGDCREPSIDP